AITSGDMCMFMCRSRSPSSLIGLPLVGSGIAPSIALVRIVVVCVGRLRSAPFADDVAHYERLLARQARIEIQEVRDEAGVPKRIPDSAFVCVLDREGTALSSTELAGFLEERRSSGKDLCFVVGGPFGLDPGVVQRADK